MKIVKIIMSVSDELNVIVKEYKIKKETPRTYQTESRTINKSKLMKVDTIFKNSVDAHHSYINFFTYCLPEDRDKARRMLVSEIVKTVDSISKNVYKLTNAIKSINHEQTTKNKTTN